MVTGRFHTVRIGVKSLLLHKLRSFLTILGLLFGVSSVISMLAVGEGAYRLTLTLRSSRLEPIERQQPDVHCDWHTFQNLLLSNLTFPEAIAAGRLRTKHPSARRTLAALFPPKLFWQSPFELLRL